MRYEPDHKEKTRAKLLRETARALRREGPHKLGVARVMAAAGLTVGGFYAHFKSKDDLIAQALAHALKGNSPIPTDLNDVAAQYLSPAHRDDFACGCPLAALASEAIRQPGDIRTEMTAGLKCQIERLTGITHGTDALSKRRAAIGNIAAMVGALILSRMCDDQHLSDEILNETRSWIIKHDHT